MADKITAEFLALDDVLGGDVYFGLAESYQIRYLAAAIRQFKEICPGLHYHITGSGLVFRPLAPKLETKIYLIWKKYQVFTPIAERLLRLLESEFSSIYTAHQLNLQCNLTADRQPGTFPEASM